MLDITFIGYSNSGYLYLFTLLCVLNIFHFGKNQRKKTINSRNRIMWKDIGKIAKVIGDAHIFAVKIDTEHVTKHVNARKKHTHELEQMSFGFRKRVENIMRKERGSEWKDKRKQKHSCQFGVNLLRKWSVPFSYKCDMWIDIAWQKRVKTACGHFIGNNFRSIEYNWWLTTVQVQYKKHQQISASNRTSVRLFVCSFIFHSHNRKITFAYFAKSIDCFWNACNWYWFVWRRSLIP